MAAVLANAAPFAAFVVLGLVWATGHHLTDGGTRHGR